MTDLATPSTVSLAQPRSAGLPLTLAGGLGAGLALGVIARAWMRLIAEDPEFSWAGTIFILLAFTIFGLTQSVARVVRQRARRRWTLTIARVFGVVGFLPLFVGAGSIMLPTVVGGGLAAWRADWRRALRVVCAIAALGPVVLVSSQLVGSFGWSLHAAVGFVGLLAIYGTIIAATRFTLEPKADGWKLSRRVKVPIFVVLGLVLTYALVGLAGS
jgi:F0F1-type ATP synthase membrane subunit c/vacuolar-type H+-ATPase subunit K